MASGGGNDSSAITPPVYEFVDKPDTLFAPCRNNATDSVFCLMANLMGGITLYVFPFIALFGMWANSFCAYLFLRGMKEKSRHVLYLGYLAVADTLCIVSVGIFWFVPAKGVPYATGGRLGFFTYNQGEWVCKVHRFANLFISSLSCNFFLAAVGDRCFSVYFPLSFGRFQRTTAVRILLVTLLVTFLMSVPYIPLMGYYILPNSTQVVCWLTTPSVQWQVYISVFSNCPLFQSSVILAVNLALVYRLVSIRKERCSLHGNQAAKTGITSKEIGLTTVLVALSTVYVICAGFMIIGVVMGFIAQYHTHDNYILSLAYNIQDLSWHLLFLQQATNWLFYMARMPKFRMAMLNILSGRQTLHNYKDSVMSVNSAHPRKTQGPGIASTNAPKNVAEVENKL